MKKGLILLNAYYRTPSIDSQVHRLSEEFKKLGVNITIQANINFSNLIADNSVKCTYLDYDFCIYLDKDKYISSMLESCGIKLFNNHNAIVSCDDKMGTYIKLAGKGINIPKTIPGLLCYTETALITDTLCTSIETELCYPLIIKECYGSRGVGIYKINNRDELKNTLEKVKLKPYLLQEFIQSSYGRDVRVIVVGGKVLGAMLRTSNGDFRSNIGLGGSGKLYKLKAQDIALAEKIAKELDLDYCGIDLLFDDSNNPSILCEVNSNAFFDGFEKFTKINVAEKYAKHIYNQIYN